MQLVRVVLRWPPFTVTNVAENVKLLEVFPVLS